MLTEQQNHIMAAALALPPEVREEIAAQLLASVDAEGPVEIDPAFAAEIERRIDRLDRGETKLIPGDQVMKEMRDRRK